MYQVGKWCAWRWQSDARFYTAEIIQDFFENWIVRCGWGGIHNKKGNSSEKALSSYEEALNHIKKIHQHRQRRGYSLIKSI